MTATGEALAVNSSLLKHAPGHADSVDRTFDDPKLINNRTLNWDRNADYCRPRRIASRAVQYAMLSCNG